MEMSPKEKAGSLYKLYKSYLPSSIEPELSKKLGQRFALMCVEEILESTKSDLMFDGAYWVEVNFELEKII